MLKNAHLLRFRPPHRLGGVAKVAPYSSRRHPLILPFGELLHLPACRSVSAGRAIFEHPGKNRLFNSLLEGNATELGEPTARSMSNRHHRSKGYNKTVHTSSNHTNPS
jgi:hypothetical protein